MKPPFALIAIILITNMGAAKSQALEGISDIKIDTSAPYKIEFDCPRLKTGEQYKDCWASFEDESINIMNQQKIERREIIRHWYVTTRDFGGCNYSIWNFLYNSEDNVHRNFVMRKKDCGWKNKKTGETESSYINNWLSR